MNKRYKHNKEINNEKLLKKLSVEMDESKKNEIIETLIKNNIGLVNYIIQKYINKNFLIAYKILYDDMQSIGYMALWKAIIHFDTNKKIKFSTYLASVILNEIRMFVRKNKKITKDISIYTTVTENYIDGSEGTIIDIKEEEGQLNEINNVIENEFNKKFFEILKVKLNKRELSILSLYYENEVEQKDIGKKLGISQSYVSRLQRTALEKARKIYNNLDAM